MAKTLLLALLLPGLGFVGLRAVLPDTEPAIPVVAKASLPPPAIGPLSWVENRGQWPETIRFVGSMPGATVRVEAGAITLERQGESTDSESPLRLVFEGASPEIELEGMDAREGIYNYFLGNDPAKWLRNVRTFARVRMRNLYPGIDLVLGSTEVGLKYDLEVAAGADLGLVALRCDGASLLELQDGGTAVAQTTLGKVLHVPGRSWQTTPSGQVLDVECEWKVQGEHTLVVQVPGRDPDLPLIIDPGLLWSTYLGSALFLGQGDISAGVVHDPNGNVVVAGLTDGIDFLTPGAFQSTSESKKNVFVTKFRASDGAVLYTSILGGAVDQNSQAVAVDSMGRATVVGYTRSDDYPTTPGAFDPTKTAPVLQWSGFVSQLTARGNDLVFSTYIEGAQQSLSQTRAVRVDSSDRVIIGGWTNGPNFPTTAGAYQPQLAGTRDGFVARLSYDGSTLEWPRSWEGRAGSRVPMPWRLVRSIKSRSPATRTHPISRRPVGLTQRVAGVARAHREKLGFAV